MEEITTFTYGDPSLLTTWSNVPYFLTKTLEEKNFIVNKVNVEPNKFVQNIWNKIFFKIIKLFLPDSTYDYQRTPFFRISVKRKMKAAVKEYPNTNLFLSVSFSYHPKYFTTKPVIMFCDWTYDYYLEHFKKRNPDLFEKQEIRNQHNLQCSVDEMVVLFPDVANFIKNKGFCHNVRYLGNVINSPIMKMDDKQILRKSRRKSILFIGLPKYMPGLRVLVSAVQNINRKEKLIQLNVIGIDESQIDFSFDNSVHFWGYLDKSNREELRLYYNLVDNAMLFVNTTPEWSSFSATLDAMYHYTPVIVSKYRSFEQTFGTNINFGFYCANTSKKVEEKIQTIIEMNDYEYISLAKKARRVVEPFSWSNYVDKLLNSVKEI